MRARPLMRLLIVAGGLAVGLTGALSLLAALAPAPAWPACAIAAVAAPCLAAGYAARAQQRFQAGRAAAIVVVDAAWAVGFLVVAAWLVGEALR